MQRNKGGLPKGGAPYPNDSTGKKINLPPGY